MFCSVRINVYKMVYSNRKVWDIKGKNLLPPIILFSTQ